MRRALVIGWFSFELMGATAGDHIAKELAGEWLREAGLAVDIAVHEGAGRGEIRTADVDPAGYQELIFVCGPIGDGPPLNTFLERFPHARKFALNVTLLQDRSEWDPFELSLERDSSERVRADVTFGAADAVAPVVGLILVGAQDEYPTQRHADAEALLRELLAERDIAVVEIDTRLDVNAGGLCSAAQVESVIARTDAVLTTRLHGAALALRRGVPPLALDSIPGGSKLLQQMRHLDWPAAFEIGDVDLPRLRNALDFALSPAARRLARERSAAARGDVDRTRREFLDAVLAVRT